TPQVGSLRGPGHQFRALQVINTEPNGVSGEMLLRIRSYDFEIRVRSDRQQGVTSASAGMLASRRCTHTEHPIQCVYRFVEVRSGVNEMIHLIKRRHSPDLVLPTAKQTRIVSGLQDLCQVPA